MINKRLSNVEVKKVNRNNIFRFINKHKRVSKPDISSALGLSMPTVLVNIKELIGQNLVKEVGELESTGGRKAMAIASIQDYKYAIGVDITSNHIGLVLTDLSGEVLQHMRVYQPYTNSVNYYKKLGEITTFYKEKWNITDDKFLGYGISIPGIIDSENNKIMFSHALNISKVSCDMFIQFIPYHCLFINDANAAAISEIYNVNEIKNTVYLSLSNSVGGAFIEQTQSLCNENYIDGKLYLGENWRSDEFGHVTLVPDGKQCYCGKDGCFDAYCSAKKLSEYTNGDLGVFFSELEKGNKDIEKVWDEYLYYLSIQINNLRMIFDCNIIVGGYIGRYIEPYMMQLKEKAAKRNTFEEDGSYIKLCRYKVESSALGAALQQIESFISKV